MNNLLKLVGIFGIFKKKENNVPFGKKCFWNEEITI